MQKFNLYALTCPMAMVYVRRAVNDAIKNQFEGKVMIITIEASMGRDLPLFLSNVSEFVKLTEQSAIELPKDLKENWLETAEATTDELKGVTHQHLFTLMFTKKMCNA